MTKTLAQDIQYKLGNTELRAVLFAVQIEAQRYQNIPREDLPIEVATLLRARSRLANIVHGIGEPETLLLHEWEAFRTAIILEVRRYDAMLEADLPQYIADLRKAMHIVCGTIMVDRKSIEEAGRKA